MENLFSLLIGQTIGNSNEHNTFGIMNFDPNTMFFIPEFNEPETITAMENLGISPADLKSPTPNIVLDSYQQDTIPEDNVYELKLKQLSLIDDVRREREKLIDQSSFVKNSKSRKIKRKPNIIRPPRTNPSNKYDLRQERIRISQNEGKKKYAIPKKVVDPEKIVHAQDLRQAFEKKCQETANEALKKVDDVNLRKIQIEKIKLDKIEERRRLRDQRLKRIAMENEKAQKDRLKDIQIIRPIFPGNPKRKFKII